MDTENLRIFVMCTKYLSFSRVAELTYSSQPSISKRMAALEGEIGGELFVRNSRKMQLTALGEGLLPYVEALLAREDALRAYAMGQKTGRREMPLTVGVSDILTASPATSILLPVMSAIEEFGALYPEVPVQICYCKDATLHESLLRGKADLIINVVNDNHIAEQLLPETDFLRLEESENFLLYAPDVPEFSNLRDLAGSFRCIFTVEDRVATSVTYDFLRNVKVPLRVEPCDNWSDVILRVKNKQGIGILSNITANLAMQCGLKGCSLTGMDVSSSLIATWNQKENNPLLVDLAHILKCSISSA